MSSIEWTDVTWNPVTGCDRVSPGCEHCYAATMARRLKAMGSPRYQTDGDPRTSGPGFGVAVHEDVLDLPLKWRKPRRVFVNSMSDLFHPRVHPNFIAEVWARMAATPQHTYQVLTKRPKYLRTMVNDPKLARETWWILNDLIDEKVKEDEPLAQRMLEALIALQEPGGWPLPNVWLGVSVEDQQRANERIPVLVDTPAAVRFLSCEPLLGPVDLTRWTWVNPAVPQWSHYARLIDWVIVGGESGPGARPMHPQWARDLRDQCVAAGIPFFFKQWGAWRGDSTDFSAIPSAWLNEDGRFATEGEAVADGGRWQGMFRVGGHGGRDLDGRTWDQFPEAVTVDA